MAFDPLNLNSIKDRLTQAQGMVQTDLPAAMAQITDVIDEAITHFAALETDVFARLTAFETKGVTDIRGLVDGATIDVGPLVVHLPKVSQ